MTHDRPTLPSATSKARGSTPLWRSVRAAVGRLPVTISWRRIFGRPGRHFLSAATARDACFGCSRRLACPSEKLRFDQRP